MSFHTLKFDKNINLPWSHPKWLVTQIILELVPPTLDEYRFNGYLLELNLMKIEGLSKIIPYYSPNSKLKQDKTEKSFINKFYEDKFGFGKYVFKQNEKINEEVAKIVSHNIIEIAKELKLLR